MRKTIIGLMAIGALAFAACADDSNTANTDKDKPGTTVTGNDPAKAAADAGVAVQLPEAGTSTNPATSEELCDASKVGTGCAVDADCGTNGACLPFTETKGICTCATQCSQDDEETPLNEDTCPKGSRCSPALDILQGMQICMKLCTPSLGTNECGAGVACDPLYAEGLFQVSDRDVGLASCSNLACESDMDCPVMSAQECSTDDDCATINADAKCVAFSENANRCARPGKCDKASGLCNAHDKGKADVKIGDACKSDFDCGNGQACLGEQAPTGKAAGEACTANEECCGQVCNAGKCEGACLVQFRNGYCSSTGCLYDKLASAACPTGAVCGIFYPAGRCLKKCDMKNPTDCRNNPADKFGDYECRGVAFGTGGANAFGCEEGSWIPCSLFAQDGWDTLDCSIFAPKGNPTKMRCRLLDGTDAASKTDPNGYCLDNTASGN